MLKSSLAMETVYFGTSTFISATSSHNLVPQLSYHPPNKKNLQTLPSSALSDQHHGTDTHHTAIRKQICDYLELNRDTYQYFVEDDRSFDAHLASMRKGGTYGGNMELVAYARLKGVDIKVYRPGFV